MSRPLPEKIVAMVSALAEDLADWCVEGGDATLERHEQAVLARVRTVLPLLLGAVIQTSTSGLDRRLARARAACPDCGRKAKPHQVRTRQIQTICGTLDRARPWYHGGHCGRGWSVAETTLQIPPRARLSGGLIEWAARLGAVAPFREAAEVLASLTGQELGAETVRRQTEPVGATLAEAEDAATARAAGPRGTVAESELDPAPGLLVVQADGAMVRFQDGWHEVKRGLVAGWDQDEVHAPSYVAARAPAEAFGARLAAEAARRGALEVVRWEGTVTRPGLAVLREALLLGDGAVWIWNRRRRASMKPLADERFDARIELVDHWHAAGHRHTVATALFGDGPTAEAWGEARADDLLAQGGEPILAAFKAARAPSAEAAEVRRKERGSFAKNAERMDYPTLRLDGLPVGSGAIESAADHLVQRRMKRAGMRWSDDGGRAMLALRARLRSRRPIMLPRSRAA